MKLLGPPAPAALIYRREAFMLTRRKIIAGSAAALVVPGLKSGSPVVDELRRLRPMALATLCEEGDLSDLAEATRGASPAWAIAKGYPLPGTTAAKHAHRDAVSRLAALEHQINGIADALWSRRAQSWADIVAHAEIALYQADIRTDGTLAGLLSEYEEEVAMAHLLKAVTQLAGSRY